MLPFLSESSVIQLSVYTVAVLFSVCMFSIYSNALKVCVCVWVDTFFIFLVDLIKIVETMF